MSTPPTMMPTTTNGSCKPIQPVTGRFPASANVLEDTNLPFSCVLCPLASASTASSTASSTTAAAAPSSTMSATLSKIPKCDKCGAPHVRPNMTHSTPPLPASPSLRVCHLCGAEATLSLAAVQQQRQQLQQQMQMQGSNNGVERAPSDQPYCHEDVYPLPLRFVGGGGGNSHHRRHSHSSVAPVYSVPAAACPLLWIIVLDGSCTSSMYWKAVSDGLCHIINEAAATTNTLDHVRVALLTTSCTTTYEADEDDEAIRRRNQYGSPTPTKGRPDPPPRRVRGQRRTVGVWQLASPTPAVLLHTMQEGSMNDDDDDDQGRNHDDDVDDSEQVLALLGQSVVDQMVSANSPHLLAALRSLVDYDPQSCEIHGADPYNNDETTTSVVGPDVEGTVQALLDCLADVGHPAGRPPSTNTNESQYQQQQMPLMPYAGGKVTFLLANPPVSVRSPELSPMSPTSRTGPITSGDSGAGPTYCPPIGGSGGRIAFPQRVGHRFSSIAALSSSGSAENGVYEDESTADWSPDVLQSLYPDIDPDLSAVVSNLGRECAGAALGVDILCLVEMDGDVGTLDVVVDSGDNRSSNNGFKYHEDDEFEPSMQIPDFGLCWYALMSSNSGAPGPVLLPMMPANSGGGGGARIESSTALHRELLSRVPWNPHLAFGGELRLRLSPGFEVDDSPVEASSAHPRQYQLAALCSDRGLFGPASSVDESPNLWRMGVSDPFTSYCVDLRVNPAQLDLVTNPQSSSSATPVMQTCFAYTAVTLDEESGAFVTVRHMRIHTLPVGPLCEGTEALYASADPEALAVVLFHKLALASFQDGIHEVPGIAEDWLQSTLVSIYQSAERHVERPVDHDELRPGRDKNAPPAFYPNERLLDRGGELSDEQVLLGQGHDRLRSIPLMTYLIMNCDAFRFDRDRVAPLDLRVAALCQMQGMPATTLTRCIAPRIQLWSSAKAEVEPILDVVDLRAYSVSSTLEEYSDFDLVLFIDTPYLIATIDGQYWSHHHSENDSRHHGHSKKSSLPLVLGAALKRAIGEAAASYRSPPVPVYELDYSPDKEATAVGLLLDVLVEDAASPTTNHDNYDAWKADIATTVRDQLQEAP